MQKQIDCLLTVSPVDTVIEVSQIALALEPAESSVLAPLLLDTEALSADGSLNLLERLAADFGAWIGTFAERWHLQGSPCFVADGRLVTDVLDAHHSPEGDPTASIH